MFDHSFPACSFFFLSFFFNVKISSRTLITLFRPGSVHSGSASWDDCDWVFADELRVNSFPDRFPHYACTAAQSAHFGFVGSRVDTCLGVTCHQHFWQEWPGSFTCHCGKLVTWCFESSQPQTITSGLNTNFTLSPSYSFHKSSYHKSCFLAYFYSAGIQHGNLHPAGWPVLFCGPTQEPCVSHRQHRRNRKRFWKKCRWMDRKGRTRGWNGHWIKSRHTKLTLEKKFLPPLLPGFEFATFRSRVRRSTNKLSRLQNHQRNFHFRPMRSIWCQNPVTN